MVPKNSFGPKIVLDPKLFLVPWGIGLSLVLTVLTVGRVGGINFLALDKSTYQILASYFDYNWFKKFVVGWWWVVHETHFSVQPLGQDFD